MKVRLPRSLTGTHNALAYERQQLLIRLDQVDEELRGLVYSIRLIDPAWKPRKKPFKPVKPGRLPRGSIARACLKLLRAHPGIHTPELANHVAAECNVELKTTQEIEDFGSAVAMAMRRYERKGLVEIVGKNVTTGALRWRIRSLRERRPDLRLLA